ncbi:hypothetical protein [Mycobacteroides abscessus]|uniref:hypothetical protein n=1 Tax=Mycobacteroides abscessus TaxID=36809 RepID=UPI001E54FFB4
MFFDTTTAWAFPMSDEPSDAQKLILEALRKSLPPFDGFDHVCAVTAAEVDKTLGGLNRTWAAVFPDGSYMTPYHEVWNFHPNKSARELAEGDVAEYEDTTLKAQWVSGWMVTE